MKTFSNVAGTLPKFTFSNVAGTLPEFGSVASALSYLRGFTGGQRRVVVRYRNKFYVCAPSTALLYRKRILASF